MRRPNRKSLSPPSFRMRCGLCIFAGIAAVIGCDAKPPSSGPDTPGNSAPAISRSGWSQARAERRAYDGAPPVIPHMPMGANCTSCHSQTGIQFGEMGFAPPMPHAISPNQGMFARCEQCHVYVEEASLFAESGFEPLRQDLRKGKRSNPLAPPVLPHPVFMRENCLACHTGPAAREEIRCTHPERSRCVQCHVPVLEMTEFARADQ